VCDFIKDIENNILKDNNSKSKITSTVIPQLNLYFNKKLMIDIVGKRLTELKKEIDFCKRNPNIIFMKADNVTIALNKLQ